MWSQNRVYCLLFFLVALLSVVVRGDGDAHPKGDADDIANPSGGADAAAIIQQSKQMMHTSADAADGASDTSTDNKNSTAQGDTTKTFPGGGNAKNMKSHGTCVTGCATQSTQTVGCGTDLSKPECFCKSQDFVVQAFTCVNTTCPEQYHGAAGVFMSICGVVGGPGLEIPGYQSPNNLEQMPQVIPDGVNKTNSSDSAVAPPAGVIVTPPKTTPKVSTSIQYPAETNAPSAPAGTTSSASSAHLSALRSTLLAGMLAVSLLAAGFYTLL